MKRKKSLIRKAGRVVFIVFSFILACVLVFTGVLLAWSPGKVMPFLDENGNEIEGSISEKTHTNINGAEQGMFIRGKDITNPVLLFLHGGPGMPEYFLAEKYLTGLEDCFTVCWWEQRGAGLSYNPDEQAENIATEQLVDDTLEITKYLCERFGQEKIYLMGHSWGTFIGIQAAAQEPELYHAYIGISQVSQQLESEKLAYSHMLEQYQAAGNTQMVGKLEQYPIYESESALSSYLLSSLRDEAMHNLGIGTMRNMRSVVTGIFWPVMQCSAYTLSEKTNIWRGKASLNNSTELRSQLYSTNLITEVSHLEIPVYFFGGVYDYTVSYTLAKEYFDQLQAPSKGFYTFDQSAHSPMFEEKEKFLTIMQEDVLNITVNLSD